MGSQIDSEFVPTVLDRLVSPERYSEGIGSRRGGDVEEFGASLTRDLHILLNTRREEFMVPAEFEQTSTSIVNFGIPDFTKCSNLRSTADQTRLCKWIEEAIRTFEPRLRNVVVRVVDSENINSALLFHVEAKAELISGRVAFEMGLRRDTGEISVVQG
jgi:type VI secretion system protein ImpF